MIVELTVSTARLRTLLADVGVRLDQDALLRLIADTASRDLHCEVVQDARPAAVRQIAPREGYL